MRRFHLLVIGLFVLPLCVYSQNKAVTAELLFFGAQKQPKVIDLPVPEYSEEAKRTGLRGRLSIAVDFDDTGKVTAARFSSGPGPVCKSVTAPNVLELRRLAVEAAKLARIEPVSSEDGSPIRSGTIIYTFPPVDKRLEGADGEIKHYTAALESDGKSLEGAQKSLGILNGKAIELPKPAYAAAARAIRASGPVSIEVLIDEQGNIFSAEAVSGHPLLRFDSQNAACGAKFSQTFLEGKPVKVKGIITYNFVP